MPATTTASTPELCRLSASRYTPNGTTSPSALSTCGSSSLRRMRCTTQPTTNPTATPPTAASTNIPTPPSTVAPVPAATATNTRNSVRAVASLPRLSPLRMVIMRRGSPSRLPDGQRRDRVRRRHHRAQHQPRRERQARHHPPGDEADDDGGERDEPDREQPDRPQVRADAGVGRPEAPRSTAAGSAPAASRRSGRTVTSTTPGASEARRPATTSTRGAGSP